MAEGRREGSTKITIIKMVRRGITLSFKIAHGCKVDYLTFNEEAERSSAYLSYEVYNFQIKIK